MKLAIPSSNFRPDQLRWIVPPLGRGIECERERGSGYFITWNWCKRNVSATSCCKRIHWQCLLAMEMLLTQYLRFYHKNRRQKMLCAVFTKHLIKYVCLSGDKIDSRQTLRRSRAFPSKFDAKTQSKRFISKQSHWNGSSIEVAMRFFFLSLISRRN